MTLDGGASCLARDWHEIRWDWYAESREETELFRGDALLHADINHTNLLIGDDGSWVVDWAWPTRGAAFMDPAMLVIQLVAAGHSPEGAESRAARCNAWVDADPKAVDGPAGPGGAVEARTRTAAPGGAPSRLALR